LTADGYSVSDEIEGADIVIVNTCSVTSFTESKTGRFIRSISRLAPNARILVTGCFAQQHGEALLEYPGVAWVVGNGDKHRIPEILSSAGNGGTGVGTAHLADIDKGSDDAFWGGRVIGPGESGRTRFSLKIQEGCDYRCAYCIVPSLRGSSRSAPKGLLIETFKRAVDMGYKEIVLTGTHIGQYRDVNKSGLESLLEDFLKIPGDYRVRLSSLDPRDLTDTLTAMAGGDGRVCPHLHVSVQSLCADVLSRMGRPYGDFDLLMERLRSFREKFPMSGLGADFIAGHPGESGAMFETTLRNAELIGFTYGHVFRFSKRRGTKAAVMPDQVSENVKTARSAALRELLEKNRGKFLSLLFAHPLYIIIESENPARGVSGNYIKVEVPESRPPKNSWMRVALMGAVRDGYCIAKET
jgi:threonylcarbamoyladenosine tRNA methylthiotransferase MtaB